MDFLGLLRVSNVLDLFDLALRADLDVAFN